MNLSLPSMAAKYICMQTYTILYSVVNSVQLDTEKLQLVCIATLSYQFNLTYLLKLTVITISTVNGLTIGKATKYNWHLGSHLRGTLLANYEERLFF